jgi:methylmalonyl-CoA mutase cobalamin-binding subunit
MRVDAPEVQKDGASTKDTEQLFAQARLRPPGSGLQGCLLSTHFIWAKIVSRFFFQFGVEVIISSFRSSALSAIRALSSSLPNHRKVLI